MYTSESDTEMRYTDEGPVSALCKWSVDLATLPLFQRRSREHPDGFFITFELGLELDSAGEHEAHDHVAKLTPPFLEVRGVLLQDGKEVSRVVFDFFQVCMSCQQWEAHKLILAFITVILCACFISHL